VRARRWFSTPAVASRWVESITCCRWRPVSNPGLLAAPRSRVSRPERNSSAWWCWMPVVAIGSPTAPRSPRVPRLGLWAPDVDSAPTRASDESAARAGRKMLGERCLAGPREGTKGPNAAISMRQVALFCWAFGLSMLASVHVWAGPQTRVALVIGNGAYEHAPRLSNPAYPNLGSDPRGHRTAKPTSPPTRAGLAAQAAPQGPHARTTPRRPRPVA